MEAEDRPRRRRDATAATGSRVDLRERLTGAAILVVVVVLVVPSLLTGRRPTAPEPDLSGSSKTYEIDLVGSGEPATEDLRRPLPEPEAIPSPPRSANPPASAPRSDTPATSTGVRVAPTGVPPATAATGLPQRPPAAAATTASAAAPVAPPARPVVAAPAPAAVAPTAWAVQLGAFAGRDTASKLVADLRAKGYAAFMLELRRDGKVLYRVRVGPEPDRERAAAIAQRLSREGYKASVAAHP